MMPLSVSIITRLQHQHETISELIGGLTEEQLKQRVDPAKWSAFENIVHLSAYQPVFADRIDRIEKETNPSFDRYIAEKDPLFPVYLEKSLGELIRVIAVDRSAIAGKFGGMGAETLSRTGLHPKFGLLNMRQWADFFLLHEAHHLFTIFQLVQELRKTYVR
jgi:hypothetical protein